MKQVRAGCWVSEREDSCMKTSKSELRLEVRVWFPRAKKGKQQVDLQRPANSVMLVGRWGVAEGALRVGQWVKWDWWWPDCESYWMGHQKVLAGDETTWCGFWKDGWWLGWSPHQRGWALRQKQRSGEGPAWTGENRPRRPLRKGHWA